MELEDLKEVLIEYVPSSNFTFRIIKSGEIIIHTGLCENEDGELVPLDDEDDIDPDLCWSVSNSDVELPPESEEENNNE